MQSQTMPRAVAAGAVIVAAGLVLLARGPSIQLPPAPEPQTAAPAPNTEPAPPAVVAPPTPPPGALAEAKVRELEAMSETFRNTTFLIAIRDSGFVCIELLRVNGGLDDSGKWTATCSEMLAYTVSVAGNGTLHVEPMLQYFDGAGPAVPRESGPGREPQPLPRPNR